MDFNLFGSDVEYASDYGTESSPIDTGNFFSDFFNTAHSRVSEVIAPVMQDSGGPSIGSQLADAIYQFGRGKVDLAREKAVGAFLMTSEGKAIQNEGIKQTVSQYWVMIAVALVAVLMLGTLVKR